MKKCTAGYEPDFRNYEADELRRGWKKCRRPIYAAGTLGRKFNRNNTKKITWAEAKALVAQWEAADKWDGDVSLCHKRTGSAILTSLRRE